MPALPARPAKQLAVLTCMDARLDPRQFLELELGDAHVIRNAGGAPTADALRSLEISQRVLDTEEVFVVHHTDCKALTVDVDESVRQAVGAIEGHSDLPRRDRVRGFVYEVETGRLRELQS